MIAVSCGVVSIHFASQLDLSLYVHQARTVGWLSSIKGVYSHGSKILSEALQCINALLVGNQVNRPLHLQCHIISDSIVNMQALKKAFAQERG